MTDIRNSKRCIHDSYSLAAQMWDRILGVCRDIPFFMNASFDDNQNFEAIGLNERFRFLRYDRGEYFAPHRDGQYIRTNGDLSYVTVQLYLNEGKIVTIL